MKNRIRWNLVVPITLAIAHVIVLLLIFCFMWDEVINNPKAAALVALVILTGVAVVIANVMSVVAHNARRHDDRARKVPNPEQQEAHQHSAGMSRKVLTILFVIAVALLIAIQILGKSMGLW